MESCGKFNVLTYPIGCPQIIFHKRSPLFVPELSASQHRFTISGQVGFPAHIASDGDTEMIVVVFYPHTMGFFIGTSPSGFYNMEISGYDIGNRRLDQLSTRIFDSQNNAHCIGIIENWLLSELRRCRIPPHIPRIGHALQTLMADTRLSVRGLADMVCLGQKQFGRVFADYVGMKPKEYSRIVRFQKSLWMFQNHHDSYADIAYTCGYSDQSHFIREFRQFAGITPSAVSNPYSDLFTNPV